MIINSANGLILLLCFSVSLTSQLYSQEKIDQVLTTYNENIADTIKSKEQKKDSYWNRLIHGNIDRSYEKKIDITFAGAPSYTREASFGVGGMATGLYRLDRKDSIMPPSDITLVFNASVKGFFALEARGNNYFKGNKTLLSYNVGFTRKPLDFWGVSYDACNVNPVISYTRQQFRIDANYQYKLHKNFAIGGTLDFTYTDVSKIDDITYLEGQNRSFIATGLGVSLKYDSRDFIPNPKRGWYIMFRQSIFPEIFGNTKRTLYRTTFIADTYQKVWSGGLLAFDLFGQFNSDNSPWALREELGGNQRMRGYYSGRYIDNNIVSGQVELRQHIVQRFGFATWIGGGTVFPSVKKFDMKNILPNYGIGLRFEVKRNVNARIDYGFGKQTGGFVFNISEAF
ncbi:MAG: BamA/TamA family outer membrane protein [Dysgonomonas sp.]